MKRPNIIYIVADDLGFADLGCYGGRSASFGQVSPNIDNLALNGLRFTDGYSNAPVCSPTRFALMTMRYQYRLRGGMDEPINSKSKGSTVLGLPTNIPTLPSLLKDAGYSTSLIGKWHLGYPPTFGPLRSGYEEFFGIMAGGVDYFTHCSGSGDHDLFIGEEEHHEIGYITDIFSLRACEYIRSKASESHNGKPFFLSLHYTAPHWPWETREDSKISNKVSKNLFHLDGGNIHTYQKMIHHMDEGIGKLIKTLEENNLDRNTLIVFTSDNGGERFSDNWPLVGGKMDLTEGGIRVPWIVKWPEMIPSNQTTSQQCMTMDFSRTLLEIGGGAPHKDFPLDAISIKEVLFNPLNTFYRPLYWRMSHKIQRAFRSDHWKYLSIEGNEYLFDLTNDARERANLAYKYPEQLAKMREDWKKWELTMPPVPDDASTSIGYSDKDMPSR
jgi:arylsulfatase A-like enzyme